MKNATMLKLVVLLLVVVGLRASAGDITSAGVKGNWSAGATWVGGNVPAATDNVIIANGDTVTIDANITINNVTVGLGDTTSLARLTFSKTTSVAVVVNGNILIAANGAFNVSTNTITGNLVHTMSIAGNLTCNNVGVVRGTTTYNGWDMKTGSGNSTLTVCNVTFTGSGNSTVTLNGTTTLYNNNYEFAGMVINKSAAGRVILGSDVYVSSGSSSVTTAGANPVITFVRGLVQTNAYALVHTWTDGAGTVGMSDSSYVLGTFGRGISNGSTGTRDFPVGDAKGYRPFRTHNVTAGINTGHQVRVTAVFGNANTGSSTFAGGIDKVSAVRYYKLSYAKGLAANPDTMRFDRFGPSYGTNDGVAAGNANLRVATSDSTRSVWTNYGPAVMATASDSLPRIVYSDTGKAVYTIRDGQWMTVALARVTGTTENSLTGTGTSVEKVSDAPVSFGLAQNYPNPFNPSTTLKFQIAKQGYVSLKVYDMLGREVASLVNQSMAPGSYSTQWNPVGLGSGVYVYRLESANVSVARKMVLMK
jgi:hypothetical protein